LNRKGTPEGLSFLICGIGDMFGKHEEIGTSPRNSGISLDTAFSEVYHIDI
jgi:hypothetical protein